MNRENQGPECRGFRVTVSPQWRRLCGACSGSFSPAKARGPGWSAEGVTCGDKAWEAGLWPWGRNGLWPRRPHLQRSPEPARHSQRKRRATRASGEVRASRPPLHRFAALSPPPASLRRTGAGTEWHLPGSATPAAEDHNPANTAP